jgi:hypothetical protein
MQDGALAALRLQFGAAAFETGFCPVQIGLLARELCSGRFNLCFAAAMLRTKTLFVCDRLFRFLAQRTQPLPAPPGVALERCPLNVGIDCRERTGSVRNGRIGRLNPRLGSESARVYHPNLLDSSGLRPDVLVGPTTYLGVRRVPERLRISEESIR